MLMTNQKNSYDGPRYGSHVSAANAAVEPMVTKLIRFETHMAATDELPSLNIS